MSEQVQQMFASIASRYDCANDVLSFGIHRLWRQKAIRLAKIPQGAKVLDLCCGTGDFAFALASMLGESSEVIAMDFVPQMLELAEKKKRAHPAHRNIHFSQGDAMNISLASDSVDAVTIGFGIRNVDDPAICLQEIKRVLSSDGTACILEFGQVKWPGFAPLFNWYSDRIMPILGGLVTGNRDAYRYLPETSRQFPSGTRFLEIMESSGLNSCQAHPLLGGLAYVYIGKA